MGIKLENLDNEEETGDVENFIPETSETELSEIFNAESDEDTSNLSATVLGDILSGVNGGAYDYTFNEVSDEELTDGFSIGYQGTVINKSHVKTSVNYSAIELPEHLICASFACVDSGCVHNTFTAT